MVRRLLTGICAGLLCAAPALAHTSGNSEAELTVLPNGTVQGRLALATRELAALAPIDPDGDGRIEAGELERQRPHFDKLSVGLLEIRADGEPCPSHLANVVLGGENDGVDLFIDYQCHERPQEVEVQALLLAALPLSHRHALTLRAGDVTERAALGGPKRRATIHTPFGAGVSPWLWVAAGVTLLLGLGLLARRSRPTS